MREASGETIWTDHHPKGRSWDPLSKFLCTEWKKWYFHGEGIKWIHVDDRYLPCFASSKSSFQRSGICTNPPLSLEQLADLCFSETRHSVEPLHLFVSANNYVGPCTSTLEMSPRLCPVSNPVAVFLVLQLGCSVRGDSTVHPPPCANHWYGVGTSPLFRAHVRAEVSKLLVHAEVSPGLPSPPFACTKF